MSDPASVLAALRGVIDVEPAGGTQDLSSQDLPVDPIYIAGGIAVVTVVVALVTLYAVQRHQARQRALPLEARKAGLQYSETDPFGCARVAFPLFREGDGREVTNVMWRPEGDARVFDYRYYRQRRDSNGRVTQTWYPFTCATVRHDGVWPELRLMRERAFDRALTKVGLPDIQLESEEFNRMFLVQCHDPKFATDLLDPQMMELLLASEGKVSVELKGRWALLTAKPLSPAEHPWLLRLGEELLERVPPVVRDLYESYPEGDPALEDGLPFGDLLGGIGPDDQSHAGPLGGFFDGMGGARHDDLRAGPFDASRSGMSGQAQPSATPWVGTWDTERREAIRRRYDDGQPAVEYDLDGNPIAPPEEDPWADGT